MSKEQIDHRIIPEETFTKVPDVLSSESHVTGVEIRRFNLGVILKSLAQVEYFLRVYHS